MEFSKRLKELRTQSKYTMEQLAKLIGVGKSAIGNYESGLRYPKKEQLEALADIFNVDMDYLTCRTDVPNRLLGDSTLPLKSAMPLNDTIRIPLLGKVAAGTPLFNEGNIIGEEYVDPRMVADGSSLFALRVSGDSMTPVLQNGDILIVREQPDADDGDIVVATVNGEEGCVKKLKKYPDALALISLNPLYEPMIFSGEQVNSMPVAVLGKVVQVRHNI